MKEELENEFLSCSLGTKWHNHFSRARKGEMDVLTVSDW